MKLVLFVLSLFGIAYVSHALSRVDCDFNDRPHLCGWRKEWFGMRKASWRVGTTVRRAPVKDVSKTGGKFAYFRARSRPEGFRSQLRSPSIVAHNDSCLFFRCALGGDRLPYPDGMSLFRVSVVDVSASTDRAVTIWESGENTELGKFRLIKVSLQRSLADLNSVRVQFMFEAIRGGSSRAYVAIDDVKLDSCDPVNQKSMKAEVMKKKQDAFDQIRNMLPAKRPEVTFLELPESGQVRILSTNTSSMANAVRLSPDGELISGQPILSNTRTTKRRRRQRKKGKKRKGRRKNRKLQSRPRVTYNGIVTAQKVHKNNRNAAPSATPILFQRQIMCDFIEYTQRLKRCLRTFFSMLQKRPHTCGALYDDLELCLNQAGMSCVPVQDLSQARVLEIINGSLLNNFRTREVYCEEEGAFVFPSFAVANLPLQCGPRYFLKLSECSGPFSNIFQIKHGDPKLCREYYTANECQRRTTAEECNFDAETMLLYGLNLQYQFAHNPFCLHLPFSSWWPHT